MTGSPLATRKKHELEAQQAEVASGGAIAPASERVETGQASTPNYTRRQVQIRAAGIVRNEKTRVFRGFSTSASFKSPLLCQLS
jgi:hypothetical protein